MQWFVLVALFTTPADPIPHEIYDYPRIYYKTLADCERGDKIRTFELEQRVKNPRVKTNVFCVRMVVEGYLEGVENLRRKTGDLS